MEKGLNIEKEVQRKKSLESAIESSESMDISRIAFDQAPLGDSLNQILDFDPEDMKKDFAEKKSQKEHSKTQVFDANLDQKSSHQNSISQRSKDDEKSKNLKSSRKMQLELKSKSIEKRIGNIESIRINLDMNKREFSDLLMVDPSAMNRWCKGETNPPAYIYQALEWYLLATEKHPLLGNSLWLKNSDLISSLKQEDLDFIASKINLNSPKSSDSNQNLLFYKRISYLFLILFLSLFIKMIIGF